jgi:pyrimidine-nucleoside phosphorylase
MYHNTLNWDFTIQAFFIMSQSFQDWKNFSPEKIIHKKRDGACLSSAEIQGFIYYHTKELIPDYQMSALLMAIFFQGLNKAETSDLTDAMYKSGRSLPLFGPNAIDKHSTGGVGDKASFIVAPLAAACGVKVPMIAGRGLGHTGGTVDKIESIEGFKTSFPLDELEEFIKSSGLFLVGQNEEIAPSDKKLYALRDVTATVASIPLISASIMSKKIAGGASGFVMDLKIGKGSFLKTLSNARKLAKSMSDTAKRYERSMMTLISDMNHPLGLAVGNSLEIIESIETLKGKGPADLTRLSLELTGGMIHLAGLAKSHKKGIQLAKKALENGDGLKKFKELIVSQGGREEIIDKPSLLPLAKNQSILTSPKSGWIKSINALTIGQLTTRLGGGRKKKEDIIDMGVGFLFEKTVGQKIKKGEPLVTIFYNNNQKEILEEIKTLLSKSINFSSKAFKKGPLILESKINWS